MRQFFVHVVGAGAPNQAHSTKQLAETEAERLSTLPGNDKRLIRVYESVSELVPVTPPTHIWHKVIG